MGPLARTLKVAPYSFDGVASAPESESGLEQTIDPRRYSEGRYNSSTKTVGRYSNVASCSHMLSKLVRRSSGGPATVDWQLNLRGGDYWNRKGEWRRHFARSPGTFDMIAENQENEAYMSVYLSRETTPDVQIDRQKGAISAASSREVPANWRRSKGCEGADAGRWRHLLLDKRHGCKSRMVMAHETTLRDSVAPSNVPDLGDNRSDMCIVEMLGSKRWFGSRSTNPRAASPMLGGDPKLYHLSVLKVEGEVDPEIRSLRLSKQPRLDEAECAPIVCEKERSRAWSER